MVSGLGLGCGPLAIPGARGRLWCGVVRVVASGRPGFFFLTFPRPGDFFLLVGWLQVAFVRGFASMACLALYLYILGAKTHAAGEPAIGESENT